ncbi:CBASS cGAMP-activated phospholipase [Micromonospora noduli]|uniref:CBASS cGAMP-activated phospholipase n=1 Tax=Micromonospora noduli TaxID=709876 RepID=UPI000DBF3BB1|nr:CBASS cGAMP-activated phospholipase [Micromonospora noduli]RAO15037.1 Phospholipase A(2) [Micromonospora noduli]
MTTQRFQILSLDGGALRGMFSAAVLARLEEDLDIRVTDHFDLIAGTSTGGIIALGLGLGMTPREILEFYTDLGPRVFRDRSRLRGLRHLVRAKYAAEPLRAALTEVLGERTFGESTKRLVITSYNVGADDVYLFRTPHLPQLTRDWRERAVDVAMATAAAPTYLPGMPLDGTRLVDGGVWANNPAMVALTEAVGPLGLPLDAIRVFSLGTTTDMRHRSRRLDGGGLLPWARDAVEVLMRAQSESAIKQVRHFLSNDRVLRLNPTVPTGVLALDKVDADDLIGRAAHESRTASPSFNRCFADHRAPAYVPHHPAQKD